MHIRLWHSPYNGGWIWFTKQNLDRFSWGRDGTKYWWAIFGFSGAIYLQSWPWQKALTSYRYDRNERRTVRCLAIILMPLLSVALLSWWLT